MPRKKNKVVWKGPPPPDETRGRQSPYPFKTWDIGDTQRYPVDQYQAIRTAIGNLNRDKTVRYRYAKVLENGKTWVRVWRVEPI